MRVEFRGPDDELLWNRWCSGDAPKREASTFEGECEAARGEIAVLANECVESVVLELRERWSRWAPEPREASPEPAPELGPGMIGSGR